MILKQIFENGLNIDYIVNTLLLDCISKQIFDKRMDLLIKSSLQLHMPQNLAIKAHKLTLAYHQTYVLFCSRNQSNEDQGSPVPTLIIHMQQDSKIVELFQFNQNVSTFQMTSPENIVGPLPKENKLAIINLRYGQVQYHEFKFIQCLQYVHVYNFEQSKLICLVEVSSKEKHSYQTRGQKNKWMNGKNYIFFRSVPVDQVTLTYFRHEKYNKPLLTYTYGNQKQILDCHFIKQTNQKSMISIAIKVKGQERRKIWLHQVEDDKQEVKSKVSIVQIPNNFSWKQKGIFDMWQINQDQFFYALPGNTILELGSLNAKLDTRVSITGEASLFIQNTTVHFMKRHIFFRQKYFLNNKKDHFSYDFNFLNYQSQTIKVLEQSPNYWTIHDEVCPYDRSLFVEFTQDVSNNLINVVLRTFARPEELYMHMLLHVYQDFDDDLLFDAINQLSVNECS